MRAAAKCIVGFVAAAALWGGGIPVVHAQGQDGATVSVSEAAQALEAASRQFAQGQYFTSARTAFSALDARDPSVQAQAYASIAQSLAKAGLYHSASYFFVRTLQTDDTPAIRSVLSIAQEMIFRVGGDLFRRYLVRHTALDDYDSSNRNAVHYLMGKDALLRGNEKLAVTQLSSVSESSPLRAFALQLRGTSYAIQNQGALALADFTSCAASARAEKNRKITNAGDISRHWLSQQQEELENLAVRCMAGKARTLYQMGRFAEADRAYDEIPKDSYVWADILFEHAWNSFARQEYNRALGKLVSYKSPALSFVFNSEVDVLTAQSYLALCLYSDANAVVNEFNAKYEKVGQQVKSFVESNDSNLAVFYDRGKKALGAKLHVENDSYRLMNRFVRSPYFQNLVLSERVIEEERDAIERFASSGTGAPSKRVTSAKGFPGFLNLVLDWRRKSVWLLGGAFIKNSLMDYHAMLISDFEKMAFIKLEMLSRAKEALATGRPASAERVRGNLEPLRRDDQYRWGFNGEFWTDELGDYVFGLESRCRG